MDIKNRPEKYASTIGLKSFDMAGVRKSISLLMESGRDYEFRTTVVRELHEAEDFEEIGALIRGARAYYLQCFTDRDTVPCGGLHAPSRQEMETYAGIVSKYVEKVSIRGVD
jgi:pyruvate formate lyase activating enzyme